MNKYRFEYKASGKPTSFRARTKRTKVRQVEQMKTELSNLQSRVDEGMDLTAAQKAVDKLKNKVQNFDAD